MRVNARLDEISEQNLKRLQEVTGLSTTEILKHSLQLYVDEIESNALARNRQLVEEVAGKYEGREDGSTVYKDLINDYLIEKYPHR